MRDPLNTKNNAIVVNVIAGITELRYLFLRDICKEVCRKILISKMEPDKNFHVRSVSDFQKNFAQNDAQHIIYVFFLHTHFLYMQHYISSQPNGQGIF